MKLVHQLSLNNIYLGSSQADEDQMQRGAYIIPFGCVEYDRPLPKYNPEKEYLEWTGKKFKKKQIDFEPARLRAERDEKRQSVLIFLRRKHEETQFKIGSMIVNNQPIDDKWLSQKAYLESEIDMLTKNEQAIDTYQPVKLIEDDNNKSDFISLESFVQSKRLEIEKKFGIKFKGHSIDCSMENRANIRGKLDILTESPINSIKFKTNHGFIDLNLQELKLLNMAVNSYSIEMDSVEYDILDRIGAGEIDTKEEIELEFNKFSDNISQRDYSKKVE